MKLLTSKVGLFAAAALFAATFTATAQAQDRHLFRVNVPFTFVAGDQSMPAGNYMVRLDPKFNTLDLTPTAGTGIRRVMLKGDFAHRPGKTREGGLLTFAKYGDTMVLHGVWADGALEGHEVVRSKTEVALARSVAPSSASESDTTVEIR